MEVNDLENVFIVQSRVFREMLLTPKNQLNPDKRGLGTHWNSERTEHHATFQKAWSCSSVNWKCCVVRILETPSKLWPFFTQEIICGEYLIEFARGCQQFSQRIMAF